MMELIDQFNIVVKKFYYSGYKEFRAYSYLPMKRSFLSAFTLHFHNINIIFVSLY